MKKIPLFLIPFLLVSSNTFAAADALGWLAGHWCGSNRGVFNEETWLAPRAGSLIGLHRDSKEGTLRGFEYFRIVEDGDELVYWTQPNGATATAFRARSVGKNQVDFLNPVHDFPKRISYRRIDTNTLLARIDDGTDQGPRMEWTWRRDCPEP
jgi:hypothetical protein